jgi:hypothetical protein
MSDLHEMAEELKQWRVSQTLSTPFGCFSISYEMFSESGSDPSFSKGKEKERREVDSAKENQS